MFDVGETLVSEERIWREWAEYVGATPFEFFGVLGATIARGGDHREPLALFHPGFDRDSARTARASGRVVDTPGPADLYPDAVPALAALSAAGYRLGIAGNQPGSNQALFGSLGIPIEVVTSSADLGVEKPSPLFFERLATAFDLHPSAIAYVGDRVDNDVRPAAAAGLHPILLRRGPWVWIQAGRSPVPEAAAIIDDLRDIVHVVQSIA